MIVRVEKVQGSVCLIARDPYTREDKTLIAEGNLEGGGAVVEVKRGDEK